jgi:hypothetical protein
MSGPRTRNPHFTFMEKEIKENLLCSECDLSPGWGWEESDRYKSDGPFHDRELPPPGNGWEVKGLCPYCDGRGTMVIPMAEFYGRDEQ